jgi:hypothetical protein
MFYIFHLDPLERRKGEKTKEGKEEDQARKV